MSKKAKTYKPPASRSKKFEPKKHTQKQESSSSKGYDRKWQKYRFRFLHHNPFCYACGDKAKVVDHRVPWRVNKEEYFWNIYNFIPLCTKCHNYVTGKFDRAEPPKIEEKHEWLKKRRELNGVDVKVKVVVIK